MWKLQSDVYIIVNRIQYKKVKDFTVYFIRLKCDCKTFRMKLLIAFLHPKFRMQNEYTKWHKICKEKPFNWCNRNRCTNCIEKCTKIQKKILSSYDVVNANCCHSEMFYQTYFSLKKKQIVFKVANRPKITRKLS